jgi:hypothetical protein
MDGYTFYMSQYRPTLCFALESETLLGEASLSVSLVVHGTADQDKGSFQLDSTCAIID